MSRYLELTPRPELADVLECVWIHQTDGAEGMQPIPPDGCPELIVHRLRPFAEVRADGIWEQRENVLFAGQMTRPLRLHPLGPVHVAAARFRPDGARRFLPRPAHRYTERRTPVADIHGRQAADDLMTTIRAAESDQAMADTLQDFVAGRLGPEPADHAAVRRAVALLQDAREAVSKDALVAATGLAARTLERRFRDIVGAPPRLLGAVLRFRRVFDALRGADAETWSQAAQAAGYFDHPQMARDFRRFVGCSPSAFIAARDGLALHLVAMPASAVGNIQGGAAPAR